jgi:hypothetical protein
MLFRCIASIVAPRSLAVDEAAGVEALVFFQAVSRDAAAHKLPQLLLHTWCCTEVHAYNLCTEQEALDWSIGPPSDGDVRLFESGAFKGPLYFNPARVQLLVGPATLARLQPAQAEAARRWHGMRVWTRPAADLQPRRSAA